MEMGLEFVILCLLPAKSPSQKSQKEKFETEIALEDKK
jgi:hypothetical protein